MLLISGKSICGYDNLDLSQYMKSPPNLSVTFTPKVSSFSRHLFLKVVEHLLLKVVSNACLESVSFARLK